MTSLWIIYSRRFRSLSTRMTRNHYFRGFGPWPWWQWWINTRLQSWRRRWDPSQCSLSLIGPLIDIGGWDAYIVHYFQRVVSAIFTITSVGFSIGLFVGGNLRIVGIISVTFPERNGCSSRSLWTRFITICTGTSSTTLLIDGYRHRRFRFCYMIAYKDSWQCCPFFVAEMFTKIASNVSVFF